MAGGALRLAPNPHPVPGVEGGLGAVGAGPQIHTVVFPSLLLALPFSEPALGLAPDRPWPPPVPPDVALPDPEGGAPGLGRPREAPGRPGQSGLSRSLGACPSRSDRSAILASSWSWAPARSAARTTRL